MILQPIEMLSKCWAYWDNHTNFRLVKTCAIMWTMAGVVISDKMNCSAASREAVHLLMPFQKVLMHIEPILY